MKFTIKGEGGEITVDVKNRAYSDSNDYWDGNWVNADIEIHVAGFNASFSGQLRAEEFLVFLKELKEMQKCLSGVIELKTMESIIYLRGEINKLGKISWKCKAIYPVGIGATLTFSLTSDQSYLTYLISDLEAVIKEFPVKGKP